MLSSQFKKAFGRDFDGDLKQRGQELWILGIDSVRKTLVDICGNIGPADLAAINAKGFFDTDAGYKVDAQNALGLSGVTVDIFLLNTSHFGARPDLVEPIVVHELAHLLEQTSCVPQPQFNDEDNAEAILKSLHPTVLQPKLLHNKEWALHLAIGARTILTKRLTKHRSIRAYLEAAVPSCDRVDGVRAKKGW
jgi:hypothetical protein